jgi:hypothetical protein
MARTWLSIRVELVGGRGDDYWPRPGRILLAAPKHTFHQLAIAIDDAFARWDRAHLHQFWLPDGTRAGGPDPEFDDPDETVHDDRRLTLARLKPDEQFAYEFDFGDSWLHLCTVGPNRIDPIEEFGSTPMAPIPYWGWGTIPDQYGRAWDGDDGKTRPPRDTKGTDLPRIGPWQHRR